MSTSDMPAAGPRFAVSDDIMQVLYRLVPVAPILPAGAGLTGAGAAAWLAGGAAGLAWGAMAGAAAAVAPGPGILRICPCFSLVTSVMPLSCASSSGFTLCLRAML